MKFFNQSPAKPIKLGIRQDRIRDLRRGYPWVFSHSLISKPAAKPGSFAVLKDKDNKIFATGFYDPHCPIVFRVCALDAPLDDQLVVSRIKDALELRRPLLNNQTNAVRLINGEGDLLPGLICDVFADSAIIQLDGDGPAAFWNVKAIAQEIEKIIEINNIYLKPRSGSEQTGEILKGELPEKINFLEYGMHFEADLVHGQKSGFFLDQRENRKIIRKFSENKKVLNLFSYTGGFSVAAGLGGAESVISVDIAKPAIKAAENNWQLNQLDPEKHQGIAENAFDYLERALANKNLFDLAIVDPPSFVHSKAAFEKGITAYQSLFSKSAQIIKSGGMLALSSCSSHIDFTLFLELCIDSISLAKRRARVLFASGQPSDHPFPLVCSELQYLKFILLQIS